jgi:hypothetical protein
MSDTASSPATSANPVCALIVDIDGVVSPVHGHTEWGDDVVVGNVFGPVLVSPRMCAALEDIANQPGVQPAWLTSWTPEMRAAMSPFPGRTWPTVPSLAPRRVGRRWWKQVALEAWIDRRPSITAVCWLDDELKAPSRAAAARRHLENRRISTLLVAPATTRGITPTHIESISAWLASEG